MISTTEGFTNNIPMSIIMSLPVNKHSARKSNHKISEVLDVKQKTDVRRLGVEKLKRKYMRKGHMLWSSITEKHGHTTHKNKCTCKNSYL